MACSGWGIANYINFAAPVTAAPLTLACWAVHSAVASGVMMSLFDTGGTDYFQLGANSSGNVLAGAFSGGSVANASSGATYSADAWFHAAAVFASSTSRTAYIGGGNKGSNTTSKSPSSIDTLFVGIRNVSAAWPGYLAECGVWSVALSDDEINALSHGYSPMLIRPASMLYYSPLVTSAMAAVNRKGAANTVTGTLTTQVHCKTIRELQSDGGWSPAERTRRGYILGAM